MADENPFADLIPANGAPAGDNPFADLVPDPGTRQPQASQAQSRSAWQNLSFPKKLLAAGQAGVSYVGDVAAEMAGGVGYLHGAAGDAIFGRGFSDDRAQQRRESFAAPVREFMAPDDPAEAAAKDQIGGIVGDAYEDVSRGARGIVAGQLGMQGDARQQFVDQPISRSLGDAVFEATGDPADATMAYMVPAVIESIAGMRGAKSLARAGKPSTGASRAMKASDDVDVPSAEEIKQMAARHYDEVDKSGIRVRGDEVRGVIEQLRSNPEVVKGLTDRTIAALNRADELAQAGDLSFTEIEQIRRLLKKGARGIEPDDVRTSMQAVEQFDRWVGDLKPAQLTAGDSASLSGARNTLKEARSLYHRARRSEDIAEMFDKASVEADGLYTGAGFEHSLRKQFRQLYLNKKKLRTWPTKEQQMIKNIATGGNIDRVLRTWGRMAPTGAMNAWLTFFAMQAHPVAGAVAAGAGVAKKVATNRSIRRAKELDELVRGGATN